DIEEALKKALEQVDQIDFGALKALAGLQPILAKRHYHDTGAMRWFDVSLAPVCELANLTMAHKADNSAIGQFILAVPTRGENEEQAGEFCREAARRNDDWDLIIGLSSRSWTIVELARTLIALENVRNDRPELQGDAVARREVTARLAALQTQLETELRKAF